MTLAEVIAATGLTKVELAKLYVVSRQTIHTWAKTPPRAGSHTARMATTVTVALLDMAHKKFLPFPAMSAAARQERIAIMVKKIQSMPLVPLKG